MSADKYHIRLQLEIEVYAFVKIESTESEVPQAWGDEMRLWTKISIKKIGVYVFTTTLQSISEQNYLSLLKLF